LAPQPQQSQEYLESRGLDNQLSPVATSGINLATHRAPTATATPPRNARRGPVKRRYRRATWRDGMASPHRGVEGYRLDRFASPATENAQPRLDRDRGELAYAIHRQAAPTAIGRRRSRRWMSSVGHRCRWRLRRNRFEMMNIAARKTTANGDGPRVSPPLATGPSPRRERPAIDRPRGATESSAETEVGVYPQGRPRTYRSPHAGEAGPDDRRAGISAPGANPKAIRQYTEPLDAVSQIPDDIHIRAGILSSRNTWIPSRANR